MSRALIIQKEASFFFFSHSAGFEPARGDPKRFLVSRLNRSATNASEWVLDAPSERMLTWPPVWDMEQVRLFFGSHWLTNIWTWLRQLTSRAQGIYSRASRASEAVVRSGLASLSGARPGSGGVLPGGGESARPSVPRTLGVRVRREPQRGARDWAGKREGDDGCAQRTSGGPHDLAGGAKAGCGRGRARGRPSLCVSLSLYRSGLLLA